MIIGYTTGVFDMLHIGHLNILKRSREMCDRLIVGVTTDELAQSKKGRRPVIPFSERLTIVSSIKHVSSAVPQESYDKRSAWHKHRFTRMFVGSDWRDTPEWNALEKEFSPIGVEIVYLPYTPHISSSKLSALIATLDHDDAGSTEPEFKDILASKIF